MCCGAIAVDRCFNQYDVFLQIKTIELLLIEMPPHTGVEGNAIISEKQAARESHADLERSAYEATVLSRPDDDGKI